MDSAKKSNQANKSVQAETKEEIEFQATLRDKVGLPFATAQVTLWPKLHSGEFLLFSSEEIHHIQANATNLQTTDGKQIRLKNLQRIDATGNFPVVRGEPPIEACFEFDYSEMICLVAPKPYSASATLKTHYVGSELLDWGGHSLSRGPTDLESDARSGVFRPMFGVFRASQLKTAHTVQLSECHRVLITNVRMAHVREAGIFFEIVDPS
jgi:hypothetical protein